MACYAGQLLAPAAEAYSNVWANLQPFLVFISDLCKLLVATKIVFYLIFLSKFLRYFFILIYIFLRYFLKPKKMIKKKYFLLVLHGKCGCFHTSNTELLRYLCIDKCLN